MKRFLNTNAGSDYPMKTEFCDYLKNRDSSKELAGCHYLKISLQGSIPAPPDDIGARSKNENLPEQEV